MNHNFEYIILQRLKNTYRELFLCKSINQNSILIYLPYFSSTAFIRGANCLTAFLINARSFAQTLQTDLFCFFSSASDAKGFLDLP